MVKLPEKCFIVADEEGYSNKFAKDIYKKLDERTPGVFSFNKIETVTHRNKERLLHIEKNVRGSHCFYIAESNQDPQYWLTELAFVSHTLKNSQAEEIICVLPNLFFSRQDRKDRARVPIAAKVVADMVGLYADRILTVDVHSQQIQGFYDIPFDSLPSFRTVAEYLQENHPKIIEDKNLAIASPDAGGGKRAESFAGRLRNPNIAIGYKIRIKNGDVEEIRFPKEQVEGKNILLIDDIIDSGGTLVEAYEELKKKGAQKIYAYCTHAFFTEGYDILKKFDRMFIGDTVKQPYVSRAKIPSKLERKLDVIPFAPLFAEAIYRTCIGESLSALFK